MGATLTRRLSLRLHPVQDAFCRSTAPVRGFLGGRGAGKSYVGCLDLMRRARPGRTYLVVAPTYAMLHDATFRSFVEIGRSLGLIRPEAVKASVPPSVELSTGATVLFRSGDLPDRLRGGSYSGCLLDEGAQLTRDVYEIVVASLRERGERGWLSVCTTPRGLSHWTYHVFGKPNADVETFHAATRQNPFLPPNFEHDVRLQFGAGLRAAQELDGRFLNVSGAEWPEEYFGPHLWFDGWPNPDTVVRSVLSIDTSKGVLKGDYQAFAFVVLDKNAHFWVDGAAERLDEERLLHRAIDLITLWQPTYVVVETNGAGFYLLGQLARAIIRGVRVPVLGRHHGAQVSKEARICARLGSQLARRTIHLKRGSAAMEMLRQQAMDFPEAEYDDMLDALEQGLELQGELCKPKVERRVRYEIPRY